MNDETASGRADNSSIATEHEVIYIAGPYSADTDEGKRENTMAAIDAGVEILDKGHYPFIPHLTHFVDKRTDELNYQDYMEWDEELLKRCDSFFYLGSSPGADAELNVAEGRGMTVYRSLSEVPHAE